MKDQDVVPSTESSGKKPPSKILVAVLYCVGIWGILDGITSLFGAVGATLVGGSIVRAFLGAIVFWHGYGLSHPSKKERVDGEAKLPTPTRFVITDGGDSASIQVPSSPINRFAGALLVAILVVNLVLLVDALLKRLNNYGWTHEQYIVCGLAALALVPLMLVCYPWWWFLGGETIELTPTKLVYRARFGSSREVNWDQLKNLKPCDGRFYGIGYRLQYDDPYVGMPRYIGKHIRNEEVAATLAVIESLRYRITQTSTTPSPPSPATTPESPFL